MHLICRWCGKPLDNEKYFQDGELEFSCIEIDFCNQKCFNIWEYVNLELKAWAFLLIPFDIMIEFPIGAWREKWLETSNRPETIEVDIDMKSLFL